MDYLIFQLFFLTSIVQGVILKWSGYQAILGKT